MKKLLIIDLETGNIELDQTFNEITSSYKRAIYCVKETPSDKFYTSLLPDPTSIFTLIGKQINEKDKKQLEVTRKTKYVQKVKELNNE